VKLHYKPYSIALAPHIALEESGLPYTADRVDHINKLCADGRSYLTLNPKGYVPALELDDGTVLTESIASLFCIADQAPKSGLGGQGSNRYLVVDWISFVATEIHQRFMRYPQLNITGEQEQVTLNGVRERFGHAGKRLEGRSFLVGDTLTVADIFLFVAARWLAFRNIDVKAWPALAAFMDRLNTRPAFEKVLALHAQP
jgi:glutathione S-transferase